MLGVYLKMLSRLAAERQLLQIEVALVPHVKPESAKRITDRYVQAAKPPQERRPAALALLDGFREAGFAVVHE